MTVMMMMMMTSWQKEFPTVPWVVKEELWTILEASIVSLGMTRWLRGLDEDGRREELEKAKRSRS